MEETIEEIAAPLVAAANEARKPGETWRFAFDALEDGNCVLNAIGPVSSAEMYGAREDAARTLAERIADAANGADAEGGGWRANSAPLMVRADGVLMDDETDEGCWIEARGRDFDPALDWDLVETVQFQIFQD